jgi:ABC-type branched-subunit amino acid transport system substrate-binding protein
VEAIEPDYAGPITEEILQAFNSGDYLAYSRHFDQTMLQAATEAGFQKSREQVQAAYGDYISKTFEELQENLQGVYTVVVYKAQFSKQADVEVQVVFQMIGDTVFVSGLWMK